MSQGDQSYSSNHNDDPTDDQNKHNVYLQIATPKSPNSDGFSPTEISDEDHINSLSNEIKTKVTNQIDLEILLMHREYNLVQNEISKVETQIDTMKKIHDDPQYVKYIENLIDLKETTKTQYQFPINPNESEMVTRRQSVYGIRKSFSASSDDYGDKPQIPHRTSYGGLRPVLDSNGNKICVHKRSDGVIVKVECPNCARSDFGSAQGFLNHARLSHQVEFKSQDHAALVCGTVLGDDEQDEVGLKSVKKLKELGIDPNNNLNPEMLHSLGCEDGNGPQKKKLKRSLSISKPSVSSGYLEKLYNKNGGEVDGKAQDDFKELYKDVTTRTEVELEIEDDIATPPISQDSINESSFKKGHNRRKSRGGLSAVTFEDQLPTNSAIYTSSEQAQGHSRSPSKEFSGEYILEDSIANQNSSVRFSESHYTFGSDPILGANYNPNELTPAQRRRVPTIPNPLRTRSRSSRENSN